ncbi:MAG: isoprenylcysteine carboxylmethyltransferase family protein [Lysobacter sp.]|nr:isoprenylcysteine carboxylmethyltransferase family protein [Lysobacter sp.]
MSAGPTSLDNRIPPPVVMLSIGVAMWLLARLAPQFAVHFLLQWPLATALAVAGLLCEVLPGLRFGRAGTTVNPLRPQNSSRLVVEGLNRYSRNPMYLGQLLLLFAWAVILAHPVSALLAPLFALYITRFQIVPEERSLAAHFGAEYEAYRARVRRWI